MESASRGSVVLVVGVGASLLVGVLAAFFGALSFAAEPTAVPTAVETAWIPVASPFTEAYRRLVPPPKRAFSERVGTWRLESGDGACALFEGAASTSVASVPGAWCRLAGGSIEGRYVHVLAGDEAVCMQDPCETPATRAWTVFDLRSRSSRPVPPPIRGGTWEAVDPVRSMGLFRASVRSTLLPGEAGEYWALTDVAGAALWAGRADDIAPGAGRLFGERLLSRRDGAILLSYLNVRADGSSVLGLAAFSGKGWWSIELPAGLRGAAWRLEAWEQKGNGWQAALAVFDAEGKRATTTVATP